MTSTKEVMINLMVDTTRNKVVFADCGGDFVDMVLSYLTLPMSSIFRLTGKDDIPAAGSVGNIYNSVQNLENQYFRNEACKSLILHPLDAAVSKLHSSLAICLDQNPSKARSLFYCGKCFSGRRAVCLYSGAKCDCGRIMDCSFTSIIENGTKGAVFVKESLRYIITDDFMITKVTTDSVIVMMQKFSISDRSRMEKRKVHVESSHVLHLLKCCSVSGDMLLSNTFLDIKKTIIRRTQPPEEVSRSHVSGTTKDHTIKLKLFVNKIDKKLIHAEANEEFVDFLFSLLCIPVGCIVMLSNGEINFGCFQNIHKSVTSLSSSGCVKNTDMVSVLASPKSPPFSTIKNGQLMKLAESNPEILYTCGRFPKCDWANTIVIDKSSVSKRCIDRGHYWCPVSLHDPKQYPASESTTGFLNESGYLISDHLHIMPLSAISVATNLLNVAVDGEVELITVDVGPQQALALLRASVTSKTPLTDVFLRNREGFKQRRWKEAY